MGETSPAERQAMKVSKFPSAFMILSLWTLLKMHAAELGSTTIIFGRFLPKLVKVSGYCGSNPPTPPGTNTWVGYLVSAS